MVMGNAMWHLIKQSDAISQLVLLVLLGMSVICWALFFYKYMLLRMKVRQLVTALAHLRSTHSVEQMLEAVPLFAGTISGYFLSSNLTFLKGLLEARKDVDGAALTSHQWDLMDQHIQQTVDDMITHEETYLPFLSTSAAVAPLLGLFGTVWGLVHAFVRISEKQTADIATVAPGIAEALITTLAGLIIAIPALVMFSYLSVQVRAIEHKLVQIADRFGVIVQKQLVHAHPEMSIRPAQTPRSPHATL